jgi:hypothetical protein
MCMKWSGGSETNGKGRSASLKGSRRSRNRDASTGIENEAESACPSRQLGSMCPPNSSRRSRTNRSHTSAYSPIQKLYQTAAVTTASSWLATKCSGSRVR